MDSIIELIQTIFYPFWYFLLLGIVFAASRFAALFLVGLGRLKSYHTIENSWIYLLVILFCALIGVLAGSGDLIPFCRWFLCSLLAGLLGTYLGIDKGLKISQQELEELEEEANDIN